MSIIGVSEFRLDSIARTSSSPEELSHFRHVDLDKLLFNVVKSKRLDTDVRASVLDGNITDSIDVTPSINIVIHDPDWELLDSGALSRAIDIKVGKRWYRLSTVEVDDDDITCTFIIRNAVYLMHHNRPRKVNRKKTTRAEFLLLLVRSVKKVRIKFVCKQLHKQQKIEGVRINRDEKRQPGLPNDVAITVKGAPADANQKSNIEAVLDEGHDLNAPRRANVGAIMCIIQEAEARQSATAGQFVGLFQQGRQYGWPATRDPHKDAPAFYKKFIPLVKASPKADLGTLIARVQLPLHPEEYALGCNRWRDEAENAVDQYAGGGGMRSREFKKRYDYETIENADGSNENYLAAIYRLAEEVNWRAFWVGNNLHYASEEDLFKSRHRLRIERGDEFVEGISFTINEQRKASVMILRVRMAKWFAPIGTVIRFGPKPGSKMIAGAKVRDNPANGTWLVTSITRPIFSELGEITLSKPIEEKLEPAPDIGIRQIDDGGGGTDSLGGSLGGAGAIDDSEGAVSIVESLALIAGCPSGVVTPPGQGIYVISDFAGRENSRTPGGGISDHSANDKDRAARDIGWPGINALTGPPTRGLDAGMKRIAEALGWSYTLGDSVNWKEVSNFGGTGIRIQVGWRVSDHYGHIHVGARFEGGVRPQTGTPVG